MKHPVAYCALILAASAPHAAAQLINNGFDTGFVPASGQAEVPAPWSSTAPGNSFISYDTWDHTSANGLPPTFANVFTGVTAQSGTRWAGGWDFEDMSQLMSFTLTPGQQYTVSAWVHAPNANVGFQPGGFQMGLGPTNAAFTTTIATFPVVTWAMGWTFQSANFTAPANSASLLYFFPDVYAIPGSSTYMGIDDVRITPVPSPGSFALCGLGAALCIRRRRPT
jgi:hypothetical protein